MCNVWRNADIQVLILLNEFIRRPLEVLASTLDVLVKDIPPAKKIDAIVSRVVHGMSRPFPKYLFAIRTIVVGGFRK